MNIEFFLKKSVKLPLVRGLHQFGQLLEVWQRVYYDLLRLIEAAREEGLQVVGEVEAGDLILSSVSQIK